MQFVPSPVNEHCARTLLFTSRRNNCARGHCDLPKHCYVYHFGWHETLLFTALWLQPGPNHGYVQYFCPQPGPTHCCLQHLRFRLARNTAMSSTFVSAWPETLLCPTLSFQPGPKHNCSHHFRFSLPETQLVTSLWHQPRPKHC